jgi:hypothetical protein
MRGVALGALVGTLAVAGAAPAHAAARDLSASVKVTGGISVAWHGDPARGCGAAGLCGYRGSLRARPGSVAELELTPFRGRLEGSVYLDASDAPVVRVSRDQGGESGGGCVDLARGVQMYVELAQVGRRRAIARIEEEGLSSGRCAGPAVTRLLERLPARSVSLARLRRGGVTIDLSSSRPYGAGRFSGTVTSTLKLRIARPRAEPTIGRSLLRPPPMAHSVRFAELHARYRVTSISGKFTSSFQGLAPPACVTLDACGVAGSATWAVLASGGEVVIDALILPRRSDHGVRGALAALERGRGSIDAYGEFPHARGVTTAEVSRQAGETCRDTARTAMPPITSSVSSRGFASSKTVELRLAGQEASGPDDLVRTGCPAPTQADTLDGRPPATATLPVSALRRRELELQLRGAGRFTGGAYSGTRQARLRFGLRRAGISVAYRSTR